MDTQASLVDSTAGETVLLFSIPEAKEGGDKPFLVSSLSMSRPLSLSLFFPGVGIFRCHPLAFYSFLSLLLHSNELSPLTPKGCLVLCLSTFQGELLFLPLTSAHSSSPLPFLPVSCICTASNFMWHLNTVNTGSYSVLSKTAPLGGIPR